MALCFQALLLQLSATESSDSEVNFQPSSPLLHPCFVAGKMVGTKEEGFPSRKAG